MSVLKLNNANFDEAVKNGVALVDFYADWCGPCKMLAPIVEQIAQENNSCEVYKLNVDESSELAARFGVMSIPTLVVLDGGDEIKRIVGARPKDALLAELDG